MLYDNEYLEKYVSCGGDTDRGLRISAEKIAKLIQKEKELLGYTHENKKGVKNER